MRPALLLSAVLVALAGCAADADSDDDASQATDAAITGDRSDPARARSDRSAGTATIFGRHLVLHVSDADGAAWGSVGDGNPGDEVWLDRSFDNGASWQGHVGDTKIPSGRRGWRTMMYAIDDAARFGVGAVRACGKAGDRVEIACTPWVRSPAHSGDRADRAVAALMAQYDRDKGLWSSVGWWNSANALTAVIDHASRTGAATYRYAIGRTFDRNRGDDFTNDYMDDTGWWGLAWVRAYELTRDGRYLAMAVKDAEHMWAYADATCGGGVWWSAKKDYKNAITNELFVKLAASIHNETPGDTVWLARAKQVWSWFAASGMVNAQHLVNDGLTTATCKNNGGTTWTYNQGVVLGALVELHRATGDASLLATARTLADASTKAPALHAGAVLREPCETDAKADACGVDAPSFKGIYARNLGELDRALPDRPYRGYLRAQAAAAEAHAKGTLDTYGLRWTGPFDHADAARQHSAVDLFVAAE